MSDCPVARTDAQAQILRARQTFSLMVCPLTALVILVRVIALTAGLFNQRRAARPFLLTDAPPLEPATLRLALCAECPAVTFREARTFLSEVKLWLSARLLTWFLK